MNVFSVFRGWIFQYFFSDFLWFLGSKSEIEFQFLKGSSTQWAPNERRGGEGRSQSEAPVSLLHADPYAHAIPPNTTTIPRNYTPNFPHQKSQLYKHFEKIFFWYFFLTKISFTDFVFAYSRDFSFMNLGYMKFRACRFWRDWSTWRSPAVGEYFYFLLAPPCGLFDN